MYTELPPAPPSEDALYLETIKLKNGSKLRVRYRVMDDNKIEEKKRQDERAKWRSFIQPSLSYTGVSIGYPAFANVCTGQPSVTYVNNWLTTSAVPVIGIRPYYWPSTANTLSVYPSFC